MLNLVITKVMVGRWAHLRTYVRVCTRMYTDVQATCGLLLYNMGTGAVTRVSGYVV